MLSAVQKPYNVVIPGDNSAYARPGAASFNQLPSFLRDPGELAATSTAGSASATAQFSTTPTAGSAAVSLSSGAASYATPPGQIDQVNGTAAPTAATGQKLDISV